MLGDWGPGGILAHTKCLLRTLREGVSAEMVEVYCIGEDEPYEGRKHRGHAIEKFFQIRRVIKRFRPDVIHVQKFSVAMFLYMKVFTRIPRILSLHMPYGGLRGWKGRVLYWLISPCYFLPVSSETWKGFKSLYPKARGEVFFNPIRIEEAKAKVLGEQRNDSSFVVGMVGRNADQKDWPSFHKVCDLVKLKSLKVEKLKSSGVSALQRFNLNFLNAGEKEVCNGREAIAKMNLFVMTSKHEQLPTTVLECFLLGTPICGFLPDGGTSDILQFSNGPVREAFIKERSCEKLADIVMDLMAHPEKRQALVEDGRQILEGHFDAEKNCREQLVKIYEKVEKLKG